MKNKLFQRVICLLLTLTLLATGLGFTVSAASLKVDPTKPEDNPYDASTLEEMKSVVGVLTYEEYIAGFADIDTDGKVLSTKVLRGNEILNCVGGVKVSDSDYYKNAVAENPNAWASFGDNAESSVYLSATGSASWQVVFGEEDAGFYYIKIEYFDCATSESSISSIERKLKLDGKVPFDEVSTINLVKNWVYDYDEDNSRLYNIVTEDATGEPDSYEIKYETNDDGYYKKVYEVKNGVRTITSYKLSQDINGNSMAPSSVTDPKWNTYFVQDSTGYTTEYFAFYMASGTRTITLEAEREPMIVKSIELIPATDVAVNIPTYEEYLGKYKEQGYKPAYNGSIIEIQAEFPDMISDSSVAPTNDNTSAITSPVAPNAQLYNVIGENSYNSVGQWAAYKFKVTETGLYNIAMRYKQSALEGMYVCRAIKLSGGDYGLADGTPTAPFAEAYDAEFHYNKKWQSTYVGCGDTEFVFYFEEGVEYTLYLECSLGTLKDLIHRAERVLEEVNACYLRILQLTGSDPDDYRDYGFFDIMPDVLINLLEQALELMKIKGELEDLCGTSGSHTATLETIAILLNTMGKDMGDNIAANLTTFKSYLGTLGTWINDSKRSTIIVDSIHITPMADQGGEAVSDKNALPKAKAPWYQSIWFEIRSFFYSFFVEYDQMGLTTIPDENTTTIDVWLASGRDQSQIWRTMIDADGSYTDSTGNAVSLKLVTGGTLLPSILSGKGPDVYIGLSSSEVINYAIRDAVVGISGNAKTNNGWTDADNEVFNTTYYTYKNVDGSYSTVTEERPGETPSFVSLPYSETAKPGEVFAKAALDTVTLLDVAYGIPQTMSFAMMFYRMDVLAELNLEVPESWAEMISILNVLQQNNMSIGVSYTNALEFMIYQKGGNMWMYTDETLYDSKYAGARIALDSNIALEAFKYTTSLYTNYSFPVSYDAANRFRTGEMPIIIGDYSSIYNQLVVYATEIEGLWEFCSLPGSMRENGEFNYDSLANITATVILHGVGEDLLPAWQFLQWQAGEKAQAEYGNRMVALIGPSAKYETANLKAINNLSWTAKEKRAIMNQMDHLSSVVNYPGSYIISRYMQFAFFDVVNDGANPIDAMTGYIDAINIEITRKREEFNLWTPESSDDEPPQLSQPDGSVQ